MHDLVISVVVGQWRGAWVRAARLGQNIAGLLTDLRRVQIFLLRCTALSATNKKTIETAWCFKIRP